MKLVNAKQLKSFDDILTIETLNKNYDLLGKIHQEAIKDKNKFIDWFNKTIPVISLPLYLQSQYSQTKE
jgi:hypothetical protein